MVIEFITTYSISACHYLSCEFESRSGEVNLTTLCDYVSDILQLFSPGTAVSSTNKNDSQDISEILLKVALSTITLTLTHKSVIEDCSCINAIFIYIHVGLVITVYLYTCWPCYYCIFIYMLALLLLYMYIHVGLVISLYLF